jgi:hypothetical protein
MAGDPGCDVALEVPSYAPRPVVVVACGGRELAWEPGAVRTALLAAVSCRWVLALFHGGARGADQLVECQAQALGWPVRQRRAEWLRLGMAAGPIRNQAMLEEAGGLAHRDGAELLVLAFPGGAGTAASCIREARQWHRFSGGEVRMQLLQLAERIEASTRS